MTAETMYPWVGDEPVDDARDTHLVRTPGGDQHGDEPRLLFETAAELCARVDAMGPRRFLVRGLWPHGAYGIHGAEPKAGKTWNALDLAVAVASGRRFLGHFEVDTTGPVLVFAGEGGAGSVVRRLRAVCEAADVRLEDLPIVVCTRAPHLADVVHLAEMQAAVERITPVLVVLDPLYLSARGVRPGDLTGMGELLERPQRLCEAAGASLVVVTHYNRVEGRKGAARFTGAGPAEWGRVLLSADALSRRTDLATSATTVVTELAVIGGEVPDLTFRLRRTVVADDPDDLDSPLHYSVEVLPMDQAEQADDGMPPAQRAVLDALRAATGPATVRHLQDVIAEQRTADGAKPLRRETVAKSLTALADLGLADVLEASPGMPGQWLARGCAV